MADHHHLVDEAKRIISDLDLLQTLEQYGETRLVGSVALELIVKRDIDLHVLVNTDDLSAVAEKISLDLKKNHRVKEVTIYRDRTNYGVKLSITDFPGDSGNWLIEIWITDWIENTQFAFTELLQRTLTHQQREIIMQIKEDFYYQGFLKEELRTLIYRAVLEGGVQNSQDFLAWNVGLFTGNDKKQNALF
jgi:hypothetical protein